MKHTLIILILICKPAHGFYSFEESNELICLAKNMYYEAANQGPLGQKAVAWVTVNRVKHWRWFDTICKVVYQPSLLPITKPRACQFSWTCQKNFEERIRETEEILFDNILVMAYNIIEGKDTYDFTEGATHHLRCDIAEKTWFIKNKILTVRINDHCFYKNKPKKKGA